MSSDEKKVPIQEDEPSNGSSSSSSDPPAITSQQSVPSAPVVEDETPRQAPSSTPPAPPAYPVIDNGQQPSPSPAPPSIGFTNGTTNSSSAVTSGAQPQSSIYDAPPPTYQTAMSYPAAPSYGAAPLPKLYDGQSQQPPIYFHPQPPPQFNLGAPAQSAPPSVVVQTGTRRGQGNVLVQIQNGIACRHCNNGVIIRQTDMCCLLCLILLTIFMFPPGLIFLCCIPCTVQNRCSTCRRVA